MSSVVVKRGRQLVEASAGTGKTHRISSAVVLLVARDDLRIERILVVTFTKSATAELKDRVRRRLQQALRVLEGQPTEDEFLLELKQLQAADAKGSEWPARLRRALLDFDAAAISTIHGFCHRALAENALASQLEPELAFVGDVGPWLDRVARDFWQTHTHDLDPATYAWLGKTKPPVRHSDLVKVGHARIQAPRAELRPAALPLVPPCFSALAEAHQRAARAWDSGRDELVELLGGLGASKRLNAPYNKADKLQATAEELHIWLHGTVPQSLPKKALQWTTEQLLLKASKRAKPPVDASELAHPVIQAIEELFAAIASYQAQRAAFAQALITCFAEELSQRLDRVGRSQRALTYGDLLVRLDDALQADDTLRDALLGRYQAALIDEFQDTDPVQWSIFQRLFDGEHVPLVLVGDEKQAIYSFRGADVFAYKAARPDDAEPTRLPRNYRSDQHLVAAVNHLFGRQDPRLDAPFVDPGIAFEPVEHEHGLRLEFEDGPRPPLEIRMLQRRDAASTEAWSAPLSREFAAAWVAADIESLMAESPTLEGQPLQHRDIAVLVRTHTQGAAVQAALRERGIPAVRHSQDDVLRSTQAAELRRLLAAMLQPRRRTLVGALLCSDLAGKDSNQLLELQQSEAHYERQVAHLREWAGTWRASGVNAAVRRAFRSLKTLETVLARPEGDRIATNYRHLLELLHNAERSAQLPPSALLRWLEEGMAGVQSAEAEEKEGDGPEERQLRLETDADAVRIVTVHASKGLQYPVVFCPSLWVGEKLGKAEQRRLRFHEGDRTVLDLSLNKAPTHPGIAQATQERRSEGMRLLYVALTRAKHRCVVSWGPFSGFGDSPLGYLLHARDGASPDEVSEQLKSLTDAQLLAEVQQIAAGRPEAIAVSAVIGADAPAPAPSEPEQAAPLAYLPFQRDHLDTAWRLSSFSGLASDARAKPAADEEIEDEEVDAPQPEDEGVGRDHEDEQDKPRWWAHREQPAEACAEGCRLRPGKRAGNCLHKVMELHDFQDPGALQPLVRQQLEAHGFETELAPRLGAALQRAIDTPLPGAGVPLSAIPANRRLNELDFHFALADEGVTREQLAQVLRRHASGCLPEGYAERFGRRFQDRPLAGLMKGSIDLVFEHGGRWYLADHKSSWLGHQLEDYTDEAMREAMEHHDYFLQYLLYSVALHRFLARRLRGYRPEQHFGGAYYLFLRGMGVVDGARRGVFYDPVGPALLTDLADLLSPRRGHA